MHRGEIYLIDFGQYVGSEQGGIRPALVVQNDTGNHFAPTTIICPLTSKQKHKIATHVPISSEDGGIDKNSIVLCEQIRVVDKSRILQKIGEIKNPATIQEINRKLMLSIGVNHEIRTFDKSYSG